MHSNFVSGGVRSIGDSEGDAESDGGARIDEAGDSGDSRGLCKSKDS